MTITGSLVQCEVNVLCVCGFLSVLRCGIQLGKEIQKQNGTMDNGSLKSVLFVASYQIQRTLADVFGVWLLLSCCRTNVSRDRPMRLCYFRKSGRDQWGLFFRCIINGPPAPSNRIKKNTSPVFVSFLLKSSWQQHSTVTAAIAAQCCPVLPTATQCCPLLPTASCTPQ